MVDLEVEGAAGGGDERELVRVVGRGALGAVENVGALQTLGGLGPAHKGGDAGRAGQDELKVDRGDGAVQFLVDGLKILDGDAFAGAWVALGGRGGNGGAQEGGGGDDGEAHFEM